MKKGSGTTIRIKAQEAMSAKQGAGPAQQEVKNRKQGAVFKPRIWANDMVLRICVKDLDQWCACVASRVYI